MAPNDLPADGGPTSRIAAGLYKLALVIRHQSWKASANRGLTPTQSQILALLGGSSGPLGVKAVAEQLAVTVGTASEAVSTLEAKGLLSKAKSPTDGRALVLRLTRTGRAEARRSREWPEVLVEAAGALSPSEQAGLMRGLVGMVHALQERGAVPTSRMCVGCRFFEPNRYPRQEKAHHCGYLNAPIGDADLRVDCAEMEPVAADLSAQLWDAFVGGSD